MNNNPPSPKTQRIVVTEMYEATALTMLRASDLMAQIAEDIEAVGVTGERSLALMVYLIGTSRLAKRPLAGIVRGSSASGKSYIIESVAKLFPGEAVVHAHRITPQALYHLPEGALAHKFVVAGERSRAQNDAAAEATRALREMLATGYLNKLITTSTRDGFVTQMIHQPGPIAYVESTTLRRIFDEDRNRCILLRTDESPEQTRRINLAAARRKTVPLNAHRRQRVEDIVAKHHAVQRVLKRCRVTIPFAESLAENFPCDRVESRRSFPLLLSLIEAVALLHQFQRNDDHDANNTIEAVPEDCATARDLNAGAAVDMQPQGTSQAAVRFYNRLRTYPLAQEFTTDDVAQHETVIADLQTIRKYARDLADTGHLERVRGRRGNQPARYRLADVASTAARHAGLPDAGALPRDEGRAPPPRRRVGR